MRQLHETNEPVTLQSSAEDPCTAKIHCQSDHEQIKHEAWSWS